MEDHPDISVIIAAYNASEKIGSCIDSVSGQSLHPSEIIITDDGSTDNTCEVINTISKQCPVPVRLLQQRNSGPGPARNTAAASSQCQWLAFIDCDDRWAPDRLKKQVDHIQNNSQVKFLFSNFKICPSDNSPKSIAISQDSLGITGIYISDYLDCCKKGYYALTSTVLIDKETFNTAGGFASYRTAEDTDLWCRLGMLGIPALYDSQTMIDYSVDSKMNYGRKIELTERIEQLNRLYHRAIEHNKEMQYMPIGKILVQEVIRQLTFQKRNSEIPAFLDKLEIPLGKNFFREEKIKSLCPDLIAPIFRSYHKLKRR